MTDLELTNTHVRSDMTSAHLGVASELGFPDTSDFDARLAAAQVKRAAARKPDHVVGQSSSGWFR